MKLFLPVKTSNTNAYSAHIYHITDMEGSPSFFTFINKSNVVSYDPEQGLEFNKNCKNPYFIYGGDVTDHGNSDLAITKSLIAFKKRYPENVFLIAGNREITKTRYKIELAPKFIRERLMHTQQPRWLTQQTLPLDYVVKDMQAHNQKVDSEDKDTIQKYVNSLSIEECQLIYLHWMLEKTMGCPDTFEYRREELAKTATTPISDIDVLNSFLKETAPTGLAGQYLQLAQIAAIIPNTGILTMHGGLNPYNIGRIPDMHPDDKTIDDARIWIDRFNAWFRNQIKNWIEYKVTEITEPAFSKLDDCSLPLLNTPRSIMVGDVLDKDRQYTKILESVSEYLRKNNIRVVLTGHQQCGDHPAIVRADNAVFIDGDTMPTTRDPSRANNPRGVMCHTLEIKASPDQAEVSIKAILFDNTPTQTQLTITPNQIIGDPFIGQILSDHRLVQCRLPNGDYRLFHLKGRQGSYSTMSPSEIEKLCNPTQDQDSEKRFSFAI